MRQEWLRKYGPSALLFGLFFAVFFDPIGRLVGRVIGMTSKYIGPNYSNGTRIVYRLHPLVEIALVIVLVGLLSLATAWILTLVFRSLASGLKQVGQNIAQERDHRASVREEESAPYQTSGKPAYQANGGHASEEAGRSGLGKDQSTSPGFVHWLTTFGQIRSERIVKLIFYIGTAYLLLGMIPGVLVSATTLATQVSFGEIGMFPMSAYMLSLMGPLFNLIGILLLKLACEVLLIILRAFESYHDKQAKNN